jgi:hypothetical protein
MKKLTTLFMVFAALLLVPTKGKDGGSDGEDDEEDFRNAPVQMG